MDVTVIIPTFNRRGWIGECLDSVLVQTYRSFEIIVVDDGSTDGTAEWIASKPEYNNVRVHVKQNEGASIARNKGIELATGDLIAFIDSDDMLLSEHIQKAVEAFSSNPRMGLFCCDSQMIDANGNVLFDGMTWHSALAKAKSLKIESGMRSLESIFSYSNCFPGFTLRKTVFDELGGFDQSLFPADDYDLALRVAGSNFQVFYRHEPLCLRREHNGQWSGIQNSVKTQLKLIETLELAVERQPDQLCNSTLVRKRLANLQLELGICEIKVGRRGHGAMKIAQSILRNPSQLRILGRIGRRRFANIEMANDR